MKINTPHFTIIISLVAGLGVGFLLQKSDFSVQGLAFAQPIGDAFIRILKMMAVPLIIAAIIKAITDVDLVTLSTLGKRTFGLYLASTVIAVSIGLTVVNVVKPGRFISKQTRKELDLEFSEALSVSGTSDNVLEMLFSIIPDNVFAAMTNNGQLLQVIFFVFFFAIGLLKLKPHIRQPVKNFFDTTNATIMEMVQITMHYFAPPGIFALMVTLVLSIPGYDLFMAIGSYTLTVLGGLFILIIIYGLVLHLLKKVRFIDFYKGIFPAQLLAFSTSSSAATLPVTLKCVTDNLKVKKEVAGFVLPLGCTVNMDGTSLYQAIAAVFIAQVYGIDLSLSAQLGIVLTATLASIGAASVPSAGLIMLTVILEQANIPLEGLVLIVAVDRILDMFRTVANVTGDAAVAVLMDKERT